MINKKFFLGTVAMASLVLFLPSTASACGCGCGSKGKHNSHYINHNNHNNYGYGHYKPPHKSFFPCFSFLGCGNLGNNWNHVYHAKYGKVCGVVYSDANGNGRQDNGERGARGIIVSVLDSKGHTKRARTNRLGSYCINNVAVGNATVTVREGSLPNNAVLTVGNNPSNVNVVGNKRNNAGKDGYSLPQAPALKKGKVCGTVFLDQNGNGRQDNGETGTRGIVVSVLDSNGDTKRARTRASGSYCVNNVAVGNATVTVRESTLPNNASLTVGDNPSSVIVVGNKRNNAGKDGYIFPQAPVPIETGKVCGTVFLDQNGNGRQDNGETGTRGIVISVLDSNGDTKRGRTNRLGAYCINNVAEGEATVTVRESTLPNNATLTVGNNPSTVDVVGNQRNNAGKAGYVLPQVPVSETGKICGIVFFDRNGNGVEDNGERGTRGIVVSIVDSNGDRKTTKTGNRGSYCVNNIAEGEATVTVRESTLPNNATLTVGNNPSTVDVVANQSNNAGKDGYTLPQVPAPEKGKVCGVVYLDENGNGRQDNGETGIRGIIVSVVDSNADTQTEKTTNTGAYCISNVAVGEAIVTVNESTLPNHAHLTVGDNPSSVDVVGNQRNNAGKDGYSIGGGPTD